VIDEVLILLGIEDLEHRHDRVAIAGRQRDSPEATASGGDRAAAPLGDLPRAARRRERSERN
jgi:hypothetical protein